MSVQAFNGSVMLSGAGLTDLSGTNTLWQGTFTFHDNSGVYLGTNVTVGDKIVLDTGNADIGTITSFTITSVVSAGFDQFTVQFSYDSTNSNPAGAPDVATSIGIPGAVVRVTPLSKLASLPSPGLQQLPDTFAFQISNDNSTNIIDPGLANTAVTPGSYTNANITVDAKGRLTAASNGLAVNPSATGVTSFNLRTGDITLDSVDVINALGYTPGTSSSTGSVTLVSITPANGVSGVVINADTTPDITLELGDVTPTSVAATGTVTGSNLSGTNTGDETTTSIQSKLGITTLSGSNTGDQTITLTGDVTGTGTGSFVTTLANTTVVAGSYTAANITVDGKGRITAAANGSTSATALSGGSAGAVAYQSGPSVTAFVTPGSTGQVLTANGANVPTWADQSSLSVASAVNATNASNIVVSDSAVGASTVYPVWVGTASGTQPVNTTSTKLSFVPVTGILTATGFAGNLTGNVTGNVSGTASTITGTYSGTLTSNQVTTALGATSGVATLDATGKLTTSQIPASLVGGMSYQGTWNASTNTPTITAGTGTKGYYYKVATAGTTSIDGNANWTVGDMIVYNGATWDIIQGGTSDVSSVFGRVGAVTLLSSDVTTALGFTPYNSTNPSGYTSNVGTVTSVGGTGTVSGLTLTGTVTSSGNLTLGGTLAVTASNFASQTANAFLAAPNGTAGVPTFRAIVAADIPTLNQNTTGTAASITGTYSGTITSAQITTGLGFTPYNSTNPSGYTTNTGTVTTMSIVTASGVSGSVANATTTPAVTLSFTTQAYGDNATNVATTAFVDRLRSSPTSTSTTAVIADRGKTITTAAGVTIPANVFAAGDCFSVYNNSAATITLTSGAGLTLYLVGTATTGNRTLAQRGIATVYYVSATEAVITGGGLA